jgi:hypothetical protein
VTVVSAFGAAPGVSSASIEAVKLDATSSPGFDRAEGAFRRSS